MATTNDLKNGMVLNLDGQLWSVVSFQHVKPGKGAAFVRTTLKNVLSGKTLDKTFNAGVKVETENVDRREMTYLYFDGNDYVFMDQDSYDQVSVGSNVIGDMANYMLENSNVVIARHNNEPLYVELPTAVELKVAETTPGVQGDRSQGGTKPAMLETGAEVAVPLFINEGDILKVDPRDGRYLSRVSTK